MDPTEETHDAPDRSKASTAEDVPSISISAPAPAHAATSSTTATPSTPTAHQAPPTPPPPGIYAPVPTFFSSAPSRENPIPALDLKTQLKHGLYLARNGITGLVLLGSTGEAISLSANERRELISYMRGGLDSAGFKTLPLLAGTTAQDIGGVLGQLRVAEEAGAEWGMVLSPGFYASACSASVSTAGALQQWFELVADLSPLPILIYHYPDVSNNLAIDPLTITELAKHPNIVGCKLSHGNLSQVVQIAGDMDTNHEHFATFTGLGSQLLPVLSVGGSGAIDGLAAIFPRLVVALFDLYNSGDASDETRQDMRQLQYTIAAGYGLLEKYGVLGVKTGIRVVLGLGSELNLRWPLMGSEYPAEEFEDGLAMLKTLQEGLGGE